MIGTPYSSRRPLSRIERDTIRFSASFTLNLIEPILAGFVQEREELKEVKQYEELRNHLLRYRMLERLVRSTLRLYKAGLEPESKLALGPINVYQANRIFMNELVEAQHKSSQTLQAKPQQTHETGILRRKIEQQHELLEVLLMIKEQLRTQLKEAAPHGC